MRTPRAMLARSIGLGWPVNDADRDEIMDAGLCTPEDWQMIEWADAKGEPRRNWVYQGSDWGVRYAGGKITLVSADEAEVANRGHVAQIEKQFAIQISMPDPLTGRPLTDDDVLHRRADWQAAFGLAAAMDEALATWRRTTDPEMVETALQRLERARRIAAEHGIEPRGMLDPVSAKDESMMARYAIAERVRSQSGEVADAMWFHDHGLHIVERALATTVAEGAFVGAWDLDRDDFIRPILLTAAVTIEGGDGGPVKRTVPFTATGGKPT